MSIGRIVSNSNAIKAQPPQPVRVSDGTIKFPAGHPEYYSRFQPDGMLLLDLFNNEYSEFRVDTDRDCVIHLYNHNVGARYKLFVYRTVEAPIHIGFEGEAQNYIVPGKPEGVNVLMLDVEVVDNGLGGAVNKIGPTSEKIDEIIGALNTSSIRMSEEITFNGVEIGSYKSGDKMTIGETLTNILKKFAQKTLPVTYSAPTFSITPANQAVESGTLVSPAIVPTFTQRDAGALNRYLLQLSTGGGVNVSLVDAAALQTFNQNNIQVQDGSHLNYTATVFYDEGITKLNNMGEPDPTGKILAGSLVRSLVFTGQRQAFYGADTNTANPSNGAEIRALGGKRLNSANGTTFTLNIPAGTRRILFAYPATLRDVSTVKYVELGNAEVKDTFQLINLNVEGANGFTAIGYKVYVYIPAVAFNAAATYNVTI